MTSEFKDHRIVDQHTGFVTDINYSEVDRISREDFRSAVEWETQPGKSVEVTRNSDTNITGPRGGIEQISYRRIKHYADKARFWQIIYSTSGGNWTKDLSAGTEFVKIDT